MSQVVIYDEKYAGLKEHDWDFANIDNDPISQLHPYPARFISEIPETLIREIMNEEDGVIFDPFCGSGTTLVAAQKNGFRSVGVDLNPIACLISKVKTQNITPGFLEIAESVVSHAKQAIVEEICIPPIPNLDHWFKKEIQVAIEALLQEINKVEDESAIALLRLSLSSIIVRVSNQESDTRYAAINNNYNATDVYESFSKACRKNYEILIGRGDIGHDVKIIEQDILTVTADQIGEDIDLVITSPPYPNAYEYWLYHKYRMWWLGMDPLNVREYEIGCRPKYHKKNGETEVDFFNQMSKVFELFYKVMKIGGHVGFVVGRSVIRGKEIDNAALIIEVAAKNGFILCADIKREIAATKKSFNLKYGKINTENILVFRKDNI